MLCSWSMGKYQWWPYTSILQLIWDLHSLSWQFPSFPHWDESYIEFLSHQRPKDETSGIQAHNDIQLAYIVLDLFSQQRYAFPQGRRCSRHGENVPANMDVTYFNPTLDCTQSTLIWWTFVLVCLFVCFLPGPMDFHHFNWNWNDFVYMSNS